VAEIFKAVFTPFRGSPDKVRPQTLHFQPVGESGPNGAFLKNYFELITLTIYTG
jgi:hypothetical protein